MLQPKELHDARERVSHSGLRPTRQRTELAAVLFRQGPRHVTAEALHCDAMTAGIRVSLATVYNTLRAFLDADLVRQVVVDGSRVYFDTNTDPHHHFFHEDSGDLVDIPADHVVVSALPDAPAGAEIARVDVIVRVKTNRR